MILLEKHMRSLRIGKALRFVFISTLILLACKFLSLTPNTLLAPYTPPASIHVESDGASPALASDATKSKSDYKPNSEHVANAFAAATADWSQSHTPSSVVRLAAHCTPRDITDALLRHDTRLKPKRIELAVIDVGANGGYPVTRMAISHGARWVISVEPDMRNFKRLTHLSVPKQHQQYVHYIAVHGAASDSKGTVTMKFHRDRDDFTCIDCLDVRKEEVSTSEVDKWTVDGFFFDDDLQHARIQSDSSIEVFKEMTDARVLLFKTDTQGHENEVLRGAQRLFEKGRVENLMIEFDPRLLRSKENSMAVIGQALDTGLQCVHLLFAGLTDQEKKTLSIDDTLSFGQPVTRDTMHAFYDFVVKLGKYTDLYCSKRPPAENE